MVDRMTMLAIGVAQRHSLLAQPARPGYMLSPASRMPLPQWVESGSSPALEAAAQGAGDLGDGCVHHGCRRHRQRHVAVQADEPTPRQWFHLGLCRH
jgi:hypothetical protein